MKTLLKKMKQYLILIRPYGMLFLGFTPVFSAMANGEFRSLNLIILFIIGILAHIFGFVQNDYYDIQTDRKSRYVSNRPIVTGKVTKNIALAIILFSLIFSIALTLIFFFSIYTIITLLIAHFFITIYNKYSKQIFGMEYILSLGIFSYGIYGAYSASQEVSYLALLISSIGFLQWLFSVGISANLKDVEYDSKLGIITTPIKFGVHKSGNKLIIPLSFKLYAFSIKIIHILILAYVLVNTSLYVNSLTIPATCFTALSIILLYLTKKILSTTIEKREKMLIYAGLQEGFSLILIPIALTIYLVDNIGITFTILIMLLLIIWPLIWFRALFGKRMIPLE